MTEIYTIFGDSTWPKSGVIAEKPSPYNNTVLVWEDALDVLTTQFVADVPKKLMQNTRHSTNDGNINSPYIIACITFGQSFFTSFNKNAWIFPCEQYPLGYWKGLYIQWSTPHRMHLSKLLNDLRTKKDADVICIEATYCLGILPRLCGYPKQLECMQFFPEKDAIGENHAYNTLNANMYDALPTHRETPQQKQRQDESEYPDDSHLGITPDYHAAWDSSLETGTKHTIEVTIY